MPEPTAAPGKAPAPPQSKTEQPKKKKKAGGSRPDFATLGGLVIAIGMITAGLVLEGGSVVEILQPTAAMIVFGGTFGAVMVTAPLSVLRRGMGALISVFFEKVSDTAAVVEEIIGYATKARKSGIVSLEQETETIQDPFIRKAMTLAVDGTDLQEIRKMMELEIDIEERRTEAEAKMFEAAGGYAPTIGIIGAVLGLIQVMKHLENIEEVGKGIAVAFVATIYGVGSANILFIPAANKIRARAQALLQIRELVVEGVGGIVEGLNPKLIRTKLEAYAGNDPKKKKKTAKQEPAKEKQKKPGGQPAPAASATGGR